MSVCVYILINVWIYVLMHRNIHIYLGAVSLALCISTVNVVAIWSKIHITIHI
jgi:hypothetical protein